MGLGSQAHFPTASVPPMRSSPLTESSEERSKSDSAGGLARQVLLEIVRAELTRFANALTGYKCFSSYTRVCVCMCMCVCICMCVHVLCVWVCGYACVCVCVYCVCVCACMYDVICQNECVPSVQKDSTSETRHALKQHPQRLRPASLPEGKE